jgi:peptide/nickel transport system substrate-binding protein
MTKALSGISKLIFILILTLIGCKTKNPDIQSLNKKESVFKFILSDPVENLDPVNILYSSDGHIASFIYEGLITLGTKLNELEPLIAESWEKFDDGKRFIFKIRKGIKFHNDPCFPSGKGRELTAHDIYSTFERIANNKEETASFSLFRSKIEGINEYHSGKSNSIIGIRVLNNYTIEFRLMKPYVTFLMCLATPLAYIIPKEAVYYYGENFGKHPVGTGPFRLAVWKPLQEMTFVRNENYWQTDQEGNTLPLLDEIRVRLIPNTALLTSELLKGENYLYFVDEKVLKQLSKEIDFKSKYKLIELNNGLTMRFLGFSIEKINSPISNSNIRKAIALNYDRKKIFEDTSENFIPANSLVRKELLNNIQRNWYSFTPEEAKKVLQNIPNQFKNKRIQILSSFDSKDIREVKKAVDNLGLIASVKIEPIQYYNKIIEERPDIFRVSMFPSFPDPEEYYALFYSKSSTSINLTAYNSAEFDLVFEKSMFEQNKENRTRLFLQLEDIIKRDVPAIFISHEGLRYYIIPNFVEGLKVRYSVPDYRQVWIKDNNETEN